MGQCDISAKRERGHSETQPFVSWSVPLLSTDVPALEQPEGGRAEHQGVHQYHAVPIVVESTTADYFVLYLKHDVEGTELELPVLVKRGSAGTTTLAENVEALPAERYSVEKYLIADPADVDGDCIDDITELDDLGNMSPVNPAVAIDINDGALAVPDNQTYDALAFDGVIKFVLFGIDTDRPSVYFMNTNTHRHHIFFLADLNINHEQAVFGAIVYSSNLIVPSGRAAGYYFNLSIYPPFDLVERMHALFAANVPLIEDSLALYVRNQDQPGIGRRSVPPPPY